jgi:hypothetical protein
MVIVLPEPPAMVSPAPLCTMDRQVMEMQLRAEQFVNNLNDDDVVEFESERAQTRANYGRPPAPVTDRGLRVLNARNYNVSPDGCLILG